VDAQCFHYQPKPQVNPASNYAINLMYDYCLRPASYLLPPLANCISIYSCFFFCRRSSSSWLPLTTTSPFVVLWSPLSVSFWRDLVSCSTSMGTWPVDLSLSPSTRNTQGALKSSGRVHGRAEGGCSCGPVKLTAVLSCADCPGPGSPPRAVVLEYLMYWLTVL